MLKHFVVLLILVLIVFVSSTAYTLDSFNIEVVCSSTLNNDPKYGISNLFDNDIKTCWVEGVASDGSGSMDDKIDVCCDQWRVLPFDSCAEMFIVNFPFPPRDIRISKIRIYNGYGKSEAFWKANNRIKRFGLDIYGYNGEIIHNDYTDNYSYKFQVMLKDTGWNEIIFKDYLKDRDNISYISRMRFYILETYRGTKYNDTCISEIEFCYSDKKYRITKVMEIKPEYGDWEEESDG